MPTNALELFYAYANEYERFLKNQRPAFTIMLLRPAYLIALSLICSITGMLILCLTSIGGSLVVLIIGFALFNLGTGPLAILGTGIVIGSVAPQKAGTAAAISQTGNEFGFALGVAINASIGTLVYHQRTTTLPSG